MGKKIDSLQEKNNFFFFFAVWFSGTLLFVFLHSDICYGHFSVISITQCLSPYWIYFFFCILFLIAQLEDIVFWLRNLISGRMGLGDASFFHPKIMPANCKGQLIIYVLNI